MPLDLTSLHEAVSEFFSSVRVEVEEKIEVAKKKQEGEDAYLGYSGQMKVAGRPNYVYIRVKNAQGVETKAQALNRKVALIPGLPIKVRPISEKTKNVYFVIGENYAEIDTFMANISSSFEVGPHSHRLGLGNVDLVEPERIEVGQLYVISGLTVGIKEFRYIGTDNIIRTKEDDAFTLTNPGGTTAYCLQLIVWNRDTLIFEQLSGGCQVKAEDIHRIMLDDIVLTDPDNQIPIGAVKLKGDAASIISWSYLMDAKIWIGGYLPGGGGGSIAVDDGTTLVDPTTLLSFDPAYFGVSDLGGDNAMVTFLPAPIKGQAAFYVDGGLSVGAPQMQIPNEMAATKTISKVRILVTVAPTGAAIIVDILNNGVTIFTNPANRPQIAALATDGNTTTIDIPAWASGDILTAEIDQVGSTVAGSNLTIIVAYEE